MAITTTRYVRKPLYVAAVRVTGANFMEVASWCQGDIEREEVGDKGKQRKFIRVRVHSPKYPRQTKAFIGDWLLYTEKGYKVYTNQAFLDSFDEAPETSTNGNVISGSKDILPGVTLNQAIAWLRKQPELTLEQIRELVHRGETCSLNVDLISVPSGE